MRVARRIARIAIANQQGCPDASIHPPHRVHHHTAVPDCLQQRLGQPGNGSDNQVTAQPGYDFAALDVRFQLLMALHDDNALDFGVEATIDNYLPWEEVYGDSTTAQLVSNTSGIPGLSKLGIYGPHLCQFSSTTTLDECARILYSVELEGSAAPGTAFSYGGSQWQLSGAVAEHVANSTWVQAFDAYIAEPCDLEVFTYGNMWLIQDEWNGNPDSLCGQANAHIEAGAITNLLNYARILLMHLHGGRCGDTQVMSRESVNLMQRNRTAALGTNYGMGWWIAPGIGEESTVVYDPGAFGSISWLDMERGIGGYVAIDDYHSGASRDVHAFVRQHVIPMQQQAVDEARAAAAGQ